jgi:hypothetical protein
LAGGAASELPRKEGDGATRLFVPPAPPILAGLAVWSLLALTGLAIELANSGSSPIGVKLGFAAAIGVAVLGLFAVLYCVDVRQSFIEAALAEAQETFEALTHLSVDEPSLGIVGRVLRQLEDISVLLRRTGARGAARDVDALRLRVLQRFPYAWETFER